MGGDGRGFRCGSIGRGTGKIRPPQGEPRDLFLNWTETCAAEGVADAVTNETIEMAKTHEKSEVYAFGFRSAQGEVNAFGVYSTHAESKTN